MLDTTPVTTAITKLIAKGTTEDALLAAVAYLFPHLTIAELSQADDRSGEAGDATALMCVRHTFLERSEHHSGGAWCDLGTERLGIATKRNPDAPSI